MISISWPKALKANTELIDNQINLMLFKVFLEMTILLHLNSTILMSLFYVFEDGCCLEPRFRKA